MISAADTCVTAALAYRAAGRSVIPTHRTEKRPLVPWERFQKAAPTEAEVRRMFSNDTSIGIVCGAVSGNVELLDFDVGGKLFDAWSEAVEAELPGILQNVVIQKSQRGGRHVVYRCPEVKIPGNTKLAQEPDPEAPADKLKPRTLIETRGEGGQFLAAPSPGYTLVQGTFEEIPTITEAERELFLRCARMLNTWIDARNKVTGPAPSNGTRNGSNRPGDDYNERGDVRALLEKHGWKSMRRQGDNELWRRPGKDLGAWSASLHPSHGFYAFSSNAYPFEQDKCYSPFAVYTLLEHGGDYDKAAGALGREGFGEPLKPKPEAEPVQIPRCYGVKALLAYNTERDPNCLLGDRWLCKSQSCLVTGPTGVGKSALDVQAAVLWSLGQPFFGITPVRPLKSLILQAENDEGDMAEEIKGVINGCDLASRADEIDKRVRIYRDDLTTGDKFVELVSRLAELEKPDLLHIDNMSTYAGCEESDNTAMGRFLRNQLNPVAHRYGFAFFIIDHIAKPSKDPNLQLRGGARAYMARGGAVKADWARATLDLREIAHPVYCLGAFKRGLRSGLTDSDCADAKPVRETHIRHSANGICWVRDTSLAEQQQQVQDDIIADIEELMGKGPHNKGAMCKFVEKATGKKHSTVYTKGTPENIIFQRILEKHKCPQLPNTYQVRSDG